MYVFINATTLSVLRKTDIKFQVKKAIKTPN